MSGAEFSSAIVQKGRLLPGIHGLRGIAALAVVLFHVHHIPGLATPEFFAFIGRDFGYSVHLFFIVSCYSLMHSTERHVHRERWVHEYLLKRFFRIAPLFYAILLFMIARQSLYPSLPIDWHAVLLNLTFTFGFVPFSSLVWAGWSVGVEMIFYALFPVLLVTIRTSRAALVFLILSIVVSYSIRYSLHLQHISLNPRPRWDWSYFAFASNICFFAMGLYAYRVSHAVEATSLIARRVIPLLAIAILISLMFFDLHKVVKGAGRLDLVVWGVGLTALCIWQSLLPNVFIANRFFEFIGERSFSIYLVHPIVIAFGKLQLQSIYADLSVFLGSYAFFICAAGAFVIVLAISELTYRFIEVPGIDLGRRLIARGRTA